MLSSQVKNGIMRSVERTVDHQKVKLVADVARQPNLSGVRPPEIMSAQNTSESYFAAKMGTKSDFASFA